MKNEQKIIDYTSLSLKLVEGLLTESEGDVEANIRETQDFINELLQDIVYGHEVVEDFEEADLNIKLAKAIYTPIIFYKFPEKTNEEVEEQIDDEINEVIENLRKQRDDEQRKNE